MAESLESTQEVSLTRIKVERRGKLATILGKPEGVYTLIYGEHSSPAEASLLPADTRGLLIETGMWDYVKQPLKTVDAYRRPADKHDIQFAPLINWAEEKKIPLYLCDWYAGEGWLPMGEMTALMGQTAIGLDILRRFAFSKESKVSRRNLLKAGISSWLLSPAIAGVLRGLSLKLHKLEGLSAELPKGAAKVSPQTLFFTITVRNMVIAHKAEWIMRHRGDKPHLVTAIGGYHTGLEDALLYSAEDRINFLQALSPALKRIPSETFYKSVELAFNGYNWEVKNVFEIPELKAIMA